MAAQASKGVIIEYADGRRYGIASAAIAKRVHPAAAIVAYADGTPYAEPPAKPAKRRTGKA